MFVLPEVAQFDMRRAYPYNPGMEPLSKPGVAVCPARVAGAVSLAVVLLFPAMVTAQAKLRPQRTSVVVPRFIRGQEVEPAVIHNVVLVFGDPRIALKGAVADDIEADTPAARPQRVILYSGTFDELVYGSGCSAADARVRLENRLRETLEKIDRISQLTGAQKEKLQFAGHGDIKRFFDRADRLRAMCERYAEITDLDAFQRWTADLRREAHALQQRLAEGPIDDQSLVTKMMKKTLTADQAARYARFEATPPYQPPQRGFITFEGAIELRGR
jgi:hypothetical protein